MRAAAVFLLLTLPPGCAHPPQARRAPVSQPAPAADAAVQPLPAELVSSFPTPREEPAEGPVDFARVLPILEQRCSPCHFPGGSMHDRLPFERAGTIRALGTKLFTRIKDPADQALILRFLSTPAEADTSPEPFQKSDSGY